MVVAYISKVYVYEPLLKFITNMPRFACVTAEKQQLYVPPAT